MDVEAMVASTAAAEPLLPGLWGLTPIAGMLGMIVLLYVWLTTGRLVTKSSHEREVGLLKEVIEFQQKTIDKQSAQLDSLMSVGKTVQAVLRSAGPEVDEDTAPVGGAQ